MGGREGSGWMFSSSRAAAGSGALGSAAEWLLSLKLFALGVHLDVSLSFIHRGKKAAHRAAFRLELKVTTRGEEQTEEGFFGFFL